MLIQLIGGSRSAEPVLVSKTATSNGIYNASSFGADGFDVFTVAVPNGTETKNITVNGTYTPTAPNIGFSSVTVNVPSKVINSLSITPSTSAQTINPTASVDGYAPITVSAVDNTIDANIAAGNIKSGVSILGVEGTVVELKGETKTHTLTSTGSVTITPSSGKNGLTSVTINQNLTNRGVYPGTSEKIYNTPEGYNGFSWFKVFPVTASIDANIVDSNIKDGVTILGVTGNVVELNGSTTSITPTTSAQTITPTSPSNGFTSVSVSAVTSAIDSNIQAGNIRTGVSILGVAGTYSGGGGGSPVIDPLSITPTTSAQTISAPTGVDGYAPISVAAVDNTIDANITAGNIVSGVSILGVTGSATVLNGETQNVSITSTAGNTFTPTAGKNGITSITVTPTNYNRGVSAATTSRTYSVPAGYSGHGTITVNAVDASIDANIVEGNIKSGVTILGVTGNATLANETTLSITPTTSAQSFSPTSPYTGYNSVSVGAVDNTIDANITAGNIKSGVSILGVTGTYSGGGGPDYYILKEKDSNNIIQCGSQVMNFDGIVDVGPYALAYAYYSNHSVSGAVDMSDLTTISGEYACQSMFSGCYSITSVNLSSLTTVSARFACQNMFQACGLTSANISSLTTVSGQKACNAMFTSNPSLTSVNLSSLTTISGQNGCESMFNNCGLTSVTLSALASVTGSGACQSMFRNCTSLTTLSFPALTSTSFGTQTNQFDNMLSLCTGVTVHFPSNLQSVIGSWASVTGGFGGTNTTVLFDLTATS